jgi:2-polyprenyl-3-methyl-5-hydroxy-6-metoxy-1,4-benzoquinol methylase
MQFKCNFCKSPLTQTFCDLGTSPVSNSFIKPENAQAPEPFYPLHVYACSECFLVQLPEHKSAGEIFTDDYVYFSSMSESWLAHSQAYCNTMRDRFALTPANRVIEIASNDGYLLQYFRGMGIPVLGVEPSGNVAEIARRKGVETMVRFFGIQLATELKESGVQADLLLGNNVLAHVPDINNFVAGLAIALKPEGAITMEFPHLLRLVDGVQFDTIYHEHFSYLSLTAVQRIFAAHGLVVFDVEELSTHGGSLRVFAAHRGSRQAKESARVEDLLAREKASGLTDVSRFADFAEKVKEAKRALLAFLIEAKRNGKKIAAYGAAAKGNTLLNYCGVRTDFMDFVVDRAESKQGRLLPGTRIPVLAPEAIAAAKPDYLIILPWNLREEIIAKMAHIREWGGAFVIPIPTVEIVR